MRRCLEKERITNYGHSNLVEYNCINYDLSEIQTDYQIINQQITDIQLMLDLTNQTKTFDLDIQALISCSSAALPLPIGD